MFQKTALKIITPKGLVRPTTNTFKSLPLITLYSTNANDYSHIKTLDDLAKLKNIDDVPPEVVRKLILQKTEQLNTENEIQLLKQLNKEEEYQRNSTFNEIKEKYSRPLWNVFLLSSSFYLFLNWVWFQLDYDEVEKEKKKQVEEKEQELNQLIESINKNKGSSATTTTTEQELSEGNGGKNKKYWLF